MKKMILGIILFTSGFFGLFNLSVQFINSDHNIFSNFIWIEGIVSFFYMYLISIIVGLGICIFEAYRIRLKKK
ncbi:hypothetical protein RI065_08465 [Mycoplasmatota bacterium zrk1]